MAWCMFVHSSISIRWHIHEGWQSFICGPRMENKAGTWVKLMTDAHNQSIYQWGLEIRSLTLCLWPLNHPSLSSSCTVERLALSSSIKLSSSDKAGRCFHPFVCPDWPFGTSNHTHTSLSLCSMDTLAHCKRKQKT